MRKQILIEQTRGVKCSFDLLELKQLGLPEMESMKKQCLAITKLLSSHVRINEIRDL